MAVIKFNFRLYRLILRCFAMVLLCVVSMAMINGLNTRKLHTVTSETDIQDRPTPTTSRISTTTQTTTKRSDQTKRTSHKAIIVERNPFKWKIVEKDFCTKRYPNTTILVVVHTAIEHFERRQIYRDMYGDQFYEKYGVVVLFVLGVPKDDKRNERIIEESSMYRDIIQQDFLDVYRNLTWKALSWLRFVNDYCATVSYVLKVDDDVAFDMFALRKYLRVDSYKAMISVQKTYRIICGLYRGDGLKPIRKRNSKWYVSKDEYEPDFYYPYCRGIQYIISRSTATAILKASIDERFFWIDDYFITGHLGHKINATFDDIRPLQASNGKDFLERKALFWWVKNGNMKEGKKVWNELKLSYEVEKILKNTYSNGTSSLKKRLENKKPNTPRKSRGR